MKGYNLIAVFNKTEDKWLMCRREKKPYKGLANLVGGKIEPNYAGNGNFKHILQVIKERKNFLKIVLGS